MQARRARFLQGQESPPGTQSETTVGTQECRSKPARSCGPRESSKPTTGGEKENFKDVTCWKCLQKGHMAVNSPGANCDGTQRRKRRS